MTNQQYWKQREEEALKNYLLSEEEYISRINEIYDYMLDQIQKEINGFYTKYATAEGITMADAKQRVSQLDIEEYERKAEKYVADKDFSAQANEEMRLYNATMKINRLELLKANIGLEMVDNFNDLQKYFDEILTERTLAEFQRQAGILGGIVSDVEKAAQTIVNASFHNATFSDRIWMYQGMLKSELSTLLSQGLIQGRNPRVLATDLQKRFGVQKSYAERLMRTELARVQIEAQKLSYVENGYEQYMFIATYDSKTCSVCRAMDGQIFDAALMMPATNAPPMHPACRCSTAAYMDREAFEKAIGIHDEAIENEPAITADLKEIESATNSVLERLETRIKNVDRILQKLVNEPDKKVRDALRYTYVLNDNNYVAKYYEIVEMLEAKGYTVSAVKNYWLNDDNPYNGLNTNTFAKGGYEFEIQYHTEESLKVSEQMHGLYEELRTLNEDSVAAIELDQKMRQISDKVMKPKGIEMV